MACRVQNMQAAFLSAVFFFLFVCSYPPRSCMREILQQTDKVSYFSFLMSITKHETVNRSIGKFQSSVTSFFNKGPHELTEQGTL